MSRVEEPGLRIVIESAEHEKDLLEAELRDLHADHANQILYGRSRSRWYSNSFWPKLSPRRPKSVDCEMKEGRFDFSSYILVAPRPRVRMMPSSRRTVRGANISQHLPPPPPSPQSVPHEWPTQHWQRLVEQLKELGHEVIGIGMSEDEEFVAEIFQPTTAFWVTKQEPEWFIDAMLGARAVIANDNGFADLGGLLRVPTLGIHSQFRREFLWDCAEVHSIASETACTFCHTRVDRGFSGVCKIGCSALATISPDRVSTAIAVLQNSRAV
jgi:hypothetical protein